MAQDKAGSMDRVSRLRRMIEEGDKTDLYSPNFVSHAPWHLAEARGATTDAKAPSFAATMLSNVKIKVEHAVEEGDKVVVRWRLSGTWSKPFAGVAPTNKPVSITGINIYTFVGDRIVSQDGEVDVPSFVQQALAAGVNAQACSQALKDLGRPPERLLGGVGGV